MLTGIFTRMSALIDLDAYSCSSLMLSSLLSMHLKVNTFYADRLHWISVMQL